MAFMAMGLLFLTPLLFTRLLRPSKPNALKSKTYECGEEPFGDSWIRFNARFYIVALVFVLFDIEIVFMYPWATVLGGLKPTPSAVWTKPTATSLVTGTERTIIVGLNSTLETAIKKEGLTVHHAFLEMVLFITILLIGFAYLWRYGFLEWIRSVRSP